MFSHDHYERDFRAPVYLIYQIYRERATQWVVLIRSASSDLSRGTAGGPVIPSGQVRAAEGSEQSERPRRNPAKNQRGSPMDFARFFNGLGWGRDLTESRRRAPSRPRKVDPKGISSSSTPKRDPFVIVRHRASSTPNKHLLAVRYQSQRRAIHTPLAVRHRASATPSKQLLTVRHHTPTRDTPASGDTNKHELVVRYQSRRRAHYPNTNHLPSPL